MRPITSKALLKDLRELIAAARQGVAQQVNSALVLLYWRVGKRIRQDILKEKRGGYGEQIVSAVSRELAAEFGQGFSEKNLWHMIRFVEVFPEEQIVSALRRELCWTHFKQIIYLDDPLKQDFYAEMCRIEQWSKLVTGSYFVKSQSLLLTFQVPAVQFNQERRDRLWRRQEKQKRLVLLCQTR